MAKLKPKPESPAINQKFWKNKIVREAMVPPEELVNNPDNWREHPRYQADSLQAVLDQVGIVETIKVNINSGKIVDGHLRVKLALESHQPTIPVSYLDLTPEEEALILSTLDPLGALADANQNKLNELLDRAKTPDPKLQALLEYLRVDQTLSPQTPVRMDSMTDSKTLQTATIRPVLLATDLTVIETALAKTGEINRGKALVEICTAYLNGNRQHDARPKSAA